MALFCESFSIDPVEWVPILEKCHESCEILAYLQNEEAKKSNNVIEFREKMVRHEIRKIYVELRPDCSDAVIELLRESEEDIARQIEQEHLFAKSLDNEWFMRWIN